MVRAVVSSHVFDPGHFKDSFKEFTAKDLQLVLSALQIVKLISFMKGSFLWRPLCIYNINRREFLGISTRKSPLMYIYIDTERVSSFIPLHALVRYSGAVVIPLHAESVSRKEITISLFDQPFKNSFGSQTCWNNVSTAPLNIPARVTQTIQETKTTTSNSRRLQKWCFSRPHGSIGCMCVFTVIPA